MTCPKCGSRKMSVVIDTREIRDGAITYRRRECVVCGCRYTTYERVEKIGKKRRAKDG